MKTWPRGPGDRAAAGPPGDGHMIAVRTSPPQPAAARMTIYVKPFSQGPDGRRPR